jgi:hypothetical protein
MGCAVLKSGLFTPLPGLVAEASARKWLPEFRDEER